MKRTLKLVTVVLLCVMLSAAALGCKKEEPVVTRVAALKGPTGMGLAYMMQENQGNYAIDLYDAPDNITGKFINGEIDIAAVPINLASVLYNKTEGNVVMLCLDTLGVLYVIENGTSIQSIGDLSGKTVHATGEGSTPQYILDYLLAQNNVQDATVTYVGEHAALSAMLASGEADIGMLPEPNVSNVLLKNAEARIALDLTEEWNKVSDTKLVQGCYIASRSFYDTHQGAIKQFITDCAASVKKVNTQPDAAKVIFEQGILPSEAIAAKAIPQCNIVCITGDEMKADASAMLTVLFNANPKSIGGKLPDDGLYAG